jgi:hypothetical protein
VETPCGHAFCGHCFAQLFAARAAPERALAPGEARVRPCPLCRAAVTERGAAPARALAARARRAYPELAARRRGEAAAARAALAAAAPAAATLVVACTHEPLRGRTRGARSHAWTLEVAMEAVAVPAAAAAAAAAAAPAGLVAGGIGIVSPAAAGAAAAAPPPAPAAPPATARAARSAARAAGDASTSSNGGAAAAVDLASFIDRVVVWAGLDARGLEVGNAPRVLRRAPFRVRVEAAHPSGAILIVFWKGGYDTPGPLPLVYHLRAAAGGPDEQTVGSFRLPLELARRAGGAAAAAEVDARNAAAAERAATDGGALFELMCASAGWRESLRAVVTAPSGGAAR